MTSVVKSNAQADSLQRSDFRTSISQGEGGAAAHIIEGIVADVNLVLWTVDVASKFDLKFYPNVQISSPYMHHNTGEGIYAMPDIGAKCHMCIASDGVPYVLDFIMPVETLDQTSVDLPSPTLPGQGDSIDTSTAASFAGGRVRAKPGDIMMRGRNGNFVVLHRGGVLQIGASELAQRIYIPLQNLISDISQTYRHYNTGGAINWYLAPGESETNPSTIYRETYRLLAGDKKASIRVTVGRAKDFIAETTNAADVAGLGIGAGKDNPIICEVALAPDSIEANSGAIDTKTPKATKFRYIFDKSGNAFLRSEGNILVVARKTLRIIADEDIRIDAKKNFTLTVDDTTTINGGKLLVLSGDIMKLNGGTSPVARIGDQVQISIVQPLVSFAPAAPGAPVVIGPSGGLTSGGKTQPFLTGIITSGNKSILG